MVSAFEKKFLKLQEAYPLLADKVAPNLPNNVSFCQTRAGELNAKFSLDKGAFYLHSNYNAKKECEKWFSSLNLEGVEVLIVYGMGLGYSYEFIKDWLEEDIKRYLVYLEDDVDALRCFLEFPKLEEVLDNRQTLLGFIEDWEEGLESVCSLIAEYFIQLPFYISALPSYDMHKGGEYDKIQLSLRHKIAYSNYSSFEFMHYGSGYFKNFYHTAMFLKDSYWSYGLFGKFKDFPAIICGAGPSLDKNFDLLKTLDDRALLFAGGSAINALSARGLTPHLGGSVDPNPLQYNRMSKHSSYELPTFYKGRMQFKAFHSLHGPKIYLPGSTAYPITSWFEEKLGIVADQIPEGHNVLHMLMELACYMGCNPIVFVGIDLAYTGNCLYAEGVVNKKEVDAKELTKCTELNNNSFLRKDIYGNPVYTLWKWVAESDYTGKFPNRFPEITFINATEGGLGMGDVPNMTLREVADLYLVRQYDMRQIVHQEIQQSKICGIGEEKALDVFIEMAESLRECMRLFDKIERLFKELKDAARRKNFFAMDKATERINEEKKSLEEETAYEKILLPLNGIRSILHQRQLDQIEFNEKIESDTDRLMKMCEANIEEIESHKEAIRVNIEKMEESVKEYSLRGFGSVENFFAKKDKEEREYSL